MSKEETKGLSKEEMTVADLRELAVSLKIATTEVVKDMKRKELLANIQKWEDENVAKLRTEDGKRILGAQATVEDRSERIDLGEYNGKKVTARSERELNGRIVVDTTVESGETFTDPK